MKTSESVDYKKKPGECQSILHEDEHSARVRGHSLRLAHRRKVEVKEAVMMLLSTASRDPAALRAQKERRMAPIFYLGYSRHATVVRETPQDVNNAKA